MTKLIAFATSCVLATAASAEDIQVGPGAATTIVNGGGGIAGALWDNGDTNGTTGVSHLTDPRRSILEDFVVPQGPGWIIRDLHTLFIWNTLPPGSGTGMELTFYRDADGQPGDLLGAANVTNYTEEATGRTWFGRQEADIWVELDDFVLDPGTYWVDMWILGPENGFQMVHDNPDGREDLGEALWVDYADFGGRQSGRDIFGVDYHASFQLTGIPEPASLILLGLGGLALIRRR